MLQEGEKCSKIYTNINAPALELILKGTCNITDLYVDDDGDLVLKYRDKDKDLLSILITQFDSDRIRAFMIMKLPESYYIAGMVAATAWNGEQLSHNTFAYVSKVGEDPVIILESHMLLRGGVTEENLKAWIDNFIRCINPFESKVLEVLPSVGDDGKYSKSGFWGAFGKFGAGLLKELASD